MLKINKNQLYSLPENLTHCSYCCGSFQRCQSRVVTESHGWFAAKLRSLALGHVGVSCWLTVTFKSVHAITHIKMKLLGHPWLDLYPTTKEGVVNDDCVCPSPSFFPPTDRTTHTWNTQCLQGSLEMKPNHSWQFTPKARVRQETVLLLWGFFIRKAFVPFGRKIGLGKAPQTSQQTGVVLCAVTGLVSGDSRTKKTQSPS